MLISLLLRHLYSELLGILQLVRLVALNLHTEKLKKSLFGIDMLSCRRFRRVGESFCSRIRHVKFYKKIKESWQPHPKGCCFLHPQSCLVINVGHDIDRATVFFFQVLIKTSKQISIGTAGKSALKVGNVPSFTKFLPSFKVMCPPQQAKICVTKSRNIQTLVWWRHELALTFDCYY